MSAYQFIFSQKVAHSINRHVVFWLIFALHIYFFRYYVGDLKYLLYSRTYLIRFQDLLLFLPVSLFYAYFALYFLLPRYILTEKYVRLLIAIALASILVLLFSYALTKLFDIRLAWDMPFKRANNVVQVDFMLNNGLVYPLTVSAFAIGIKMAKNFYLQQKQNEKLAMQRINADMQLLKSQVHPRFLFHSLKTIYVDLINGSNKSPGMLLKLSELLSYILYESDTKMPLEKELLLLQNYIELEQTSWGKQLVVNITEDISARDKYIEPLLLLPLAEYVFDNIDQQGQQQVVLQLDMQIKKENFLFNLTVSELAEQNENSFKKRLHLTQVEKRLQVRYPGSHQLTVTRAAGSITIFLSLKPDVINSTVNA